MNKTIVIALGLLLLILVEAAPAQQIRPPVQVIFDTDMGPDYDDVGAIALLHALADSGKAVILATIASSKYEGVAAVLNILNTYFHKPGIPIAVPKGKAVDKRDFQHWTDTLIANYPHAIHTNAEVPDAVTLYRKLLSKQPDNSVTLITVGFLTNIANLLLSGPDQYSSLNGKALVRKKVKNMVCMAGIFPSGKEFNVEEDAEASRTVFDNWQKPLLFSGFEIGRKIRTGIPLIHNDAISGSPVKDVFRISIPLDKNDSEGRMSWDETAVLVGILGHAPYYTLHRGSIVVDKNGSNTWNDKKKKQSYLVEKAPPEEVQSIINNLMMHQPQ